MIDFCKSIAERAKSLGISTITLRRTIERGEGPTVTQLSRHRLGIRESHWAAWLDTRGRKYELAMPENSPEVRARNRELLKRKRLDPAYLQKERARNAERMRLKGVEAKYKRLQEKYSAQASLLKTLEGRLASRRRKHIPQPQEFLVAE